MDNEWKPPDSERDLLDPRRMLIFAEVARSGSLAAAAQVLGWTQPAIAQHVKRLERDTGCALVIRNSRGVTLTEAGQSLAMHAEAMTARLRAARALTSARWPICAPAGSASPHSLPRAQPSCPLPLPYCRNVHPA